jgi:hypothetical protein
LENPATFSGFCLGSEAHFRKKADLVGASTMSAACLDFVTITAKHPSRRNLSEHIACSIPKTIAKIAHRTCVGSVNGKPLLKEWSLNSSGASTLHTP